MVEWGHELDYALEYVFVFPKKEGGHELFISKKCPEIIKQRVLAEWPVLEKEQYRRHANGLFTNNDYFMYES